MHCNCYILLAQKKSYLDTLISSNDYHNANNDNHDADDSGTESIRVNKKFEAAKNAYELCQLKLKECQICGKHRIEKRWDDLLFQFRLVKVDGEPACKVCVAQKKNIRSICCGYIDTCGCGGILENLHCVDCCYMMNAIDTYFPGYSMKYI